MAFEPVRIIHASHLRLDHQLEGLTHLSNDLQRLVEDATLSAFDFLLAACIDHQVDFLLLTGNTFDWQDGSLRAWSALEQGFELLAEHDIHVFVVPGESDPAAAWLNGPRWPDNVTILHAEDGEPVAAMRRGKAVATVRLLDAQGKERDGLKLPRGTSPGTGPLRLAPFTIGVMPIHSTYLQDRLSSPDAAARADDAGTHADREAIDDFGEGIVDEFTDADDEVGNGPAFGHLPFDDAHDVDVIDYIALGGPPQRQTFVTEEGLAHHSGTTQGIHINERGHCGVTLVELDRHGKGRSTFIPTGIVRWEQADVAVSSDASLEELQEAVRAKIEGLSPTSTEKVCIVRWTAPGNGRLEDHIGTPDCLREIIQQTADAKVHGKWRMLHLADWIDGRHGANTAGDRDKQDASPVPELLQDFVDGLQEIAASSPEQVAASMRRLERKLGLSVENRIQFRERLDAEEIRRRARQLGRKWFHEMRGENDAA